MSSVRLRVRRRFRYELYMLALVFLVPASLVAVFPYDAIGFALTADVAAEEPSCAFVTLSDEEAEEALNESRAYWKVDAKGARGMRLDLSESDVMEDVADSVLSFDERRRLPPPKPVRYAAPPLPPSLAAPPASQLKGHTRPVAMSTETFSREELLDDSVVDLKGN